MRRTLLAGPQPHAATYVARRALAILVLAALAIVAADPWAVERNPYHAHVVLGGDALQQVQALTGHLYHALRATARPRQLPSSSAGHLLGWCVELTTDGDASTPDVVAVRAAQTAGASVVGVGGGALPPSVRIVMADLEPVERFTAQAAITPLDPALPVPEPPPRAS